MISFLFLGLVFFVPQLGAGDRIRSCKGGNVKLFENTTKDLHVTLYYEKTTLCVWDPTQGRSSACPERVVRDDKYTIRLDNVSKNDEGNYSWKSPKLPAKNVTLIVSDTCCEPELRNTVENDRIIWIIILVVISVLLLIALVVCCRCNQKLKGQIRRMESYRLDPNANLTL